MTRPAIQAFTDYPDSVLRSVTVLRFDGNKYAVVRHADGREESVKAGYVYANEAKRRLNDMAWHLLSGGTRRNYKRRQRKTTYRLLGTDGYDSQPRAYEAFEFNDLAGALHVASVEAAAHGEDVLVVSRYSAHNRSVLSERAITVTEDGEAYEAGPAGQVKYLRGYGKHATSLR